MQLQKLGLKPGIYFGLPDEQYHKDPALSRGGIQHLITHYYDYYENSVLNPKYTPSTATDSMEFGRLCHMKLLEPGNFDATYRPALSAYEAKRRPLSTSLWESIQSSMDMLRLVAPNYIAKGFPEVTIVWEDPGTGLLMRARIDYLRTFGCLDYKRCADIDPNKLGWHILRYGYDLQAKLYSDGLAEIKRLLANEPGRLVIQGDVDKKWLHALSQDEDNEFLFLFQRSTPPYVYRFYWLDKEIMDNAGVIIDSGKGIYLDCVKRFGLKNWPPGNSEPEEFSIYHMPRRAFDRGAKPL